MKTLDEFARINKIEGNVFISFDLTEMEICDHIACGALRLECPDFIMPVLFDRSTSITTMRYSIPDHYSDVEKFQGELQIEEILTLYGSIIEMLQVCEDWYLRPEGFYFDAKYVYMNDTHNAFRFIYVPESKHKLDTQQIKYLMISLLEKCNESSGGNIQLQLYKYFYKPKFSLTEFKTMLESFWMSLSKKAKNSPSEGLEQSTSTIKPENKEKVTMTQGASGYGVKETEGKRVTVGSSNKNESSANISAKNKEVLTKQQESYRANKLVEEKPKEQIIENVEKEDAPRSFYAPKVNRSQLSQEEIEEMVKSIYSGKTVENKDENVNTNNNYGIHEQVMGESRTEGEDPIAEGESFYGAKSKEADNINANNKKKNLFDNMFNQAKPQKSSIYTSSMQGRSVSLKSISIHSRYDLPKLIEVQFVDDLFVIGRGTRTGEPTGANYEFGAEITPISRLHAEIERKEGSYYLQDLGSSNGTFLNGNKIEPNKPYLIEDGDKIAFAIAYSKNSIEYAFVE